MINRRYISIIILLCITWNAKLHSQKVVVSYNGRFLMTEDGAPFFWLADTAWELLHRCDREEVDYYLNVRKKQGFNVIHTVALAEIDGLNNPNPYGHIPLLNNDPNRPDDRYFQHVDYVIDKADELGLYVALLPTWGDKLFKNSWGVGPEVLNPDNAGAFGRWIGERYADRDNIIWVIGGDRNPREGSHDVEVWRAMAEGVAEGVGGHDKALMTFHPQPQDIGGSSTWFHNDAWLDFNMHQTGHCANRGTHKNIQHDYNLFPIKPVLDGEPLYEDHPNCFNAKELGYSRASDIRRLMYWNVFAGGFGQSYGCHAVWQMFTNDRDPINGPLRPWKEALELPMATQAKHLKNLMLSRPFFTRIPDQTMVRSYQEDDNTYVIATRDSDGTYAMIYFPTGKTVSLDLTSIHGAVVAHWYDPRSGVSFDGPEIVQKKEVVVLPPSSGVGNDWVLIVDSMGNIR